MDRDLWFREFWRSVAAQDEQALAAYFAEDACVRWHNTDECFTVVEYLRANCEYPGEWRGEVERIEHMGDLTVTAARVWLADGSASFHAVSFFRLRGEKIAELDEYWGDDGEPPQWRLDQRIGTRIR